MIRSYIDDLIVITKNNYEESLKDLYKFLQRLAESGLKVNSEKYFFGQTETEYIGCWVSNNGVIPLFYQSRSY